MREKVKRYSKNCTYILLLYGCYIYIGCHTWNKELTERQIINESGNPLKWKCKKGLITHQEYLDETELLSVFEFDTPEEALDYEERLITKAKEIYGKRCLNKVPGNSERCKGVPRDEETKNKISKSHLGKKRSPFSNEWKQHMSEAQMGEKNHFYGKHHTEEAKQKMSMSSKGRCKGLLWFNNGIKSVRSFECPEGFVPGRIRWANQN